ncbi:MAG: PIN domain-containing protein, partial [Acidobacteriota bacterium]|nr:PIN domain-containing protein [Acidobacteriota bacterium]
MKKTFVLDANVLLHDPVSLFRFADNEVVVPVVVIEELDQFKREMTERGRNAREVSRLLDQLGHQGRLVDGVATPDGGVIIIHLGVPVPKDFPFLDDEASADMRILGLAWTLNDARPPVTFVTKDTNLRIKAEAVGIHAVDYMEKGGRLDTDRLGYLEVHVERGAIDALYRDGRMTVETLGIDDPGPNRCLLLLDRADAQHSAPARRQPSEPVVAPQRLPRSVSGIAPRNVEQKFALDLLLDPAVPLVCLAGKAGTGKTLLALAAGLMQTVERKTYRRLLVARPIYPMGRDLGYLPGELDEKLRPWMQPIFDNLELLLGPPQDSPRQG